MLTVGILTLIGVGLFALYTRNEKFRNWVYKLFNPEDPQDPPPLLSPLFPPFFLFVNTQNSEPQL